MFVDSCKRLRIMKGSEAIGLGTLRLYSSDFCFKFLVSSLNIVIIIVIFSTKSHGEMQEQMLMEYL